MFIRDNKNKVTFHNVNIIYLTLCYLIMLSCQNDDVFNMMT